MPSLVLKPLMFRPIMHTLKTGRLSPGSSARVHEAKVSSSHSGRFTSVGRQFATAHAEAGSCLYMYHPAATQSSSSVRPATSTSIYPRVISTLRQHTLRPLQRHNCVATTSSCSTRFFSKCDLSAADDSRHTANCQIG